MFNLNNHTEINMGTKGELTRQRILDTAAQMFWKSSYHSVRIDKIVAQAQVNKASFYQYFKNKEQAAFDGIELMHQRTKEKVFDASFAKTKDPVKRLESIFKEIYNIHKSLKSNDGCTPGCPFVNMGNELASDNEKIRKKVAAIFEDFYAYHEQVFSVAQQLKLTKVTQKPEYIARQVQGILNGAMSSAKIRNRPQDILDALHTAKAVMGFV